MKRTEETMSETVKTNALSITTADQDNRIKYNTSSTQTNAGNQSLRFSDRPPFLWLRFLGWFGSGVGFGWLIRNFTISASAGANNVANAAIGALIAIAIAAQSWIVIHPVLVHLREVRKRQAYITNQGATATAAPPQN
jgi:hypothetical protein